MMMMMCCRKFPFLLVLVLAPVSVRSFLGTSSPSGRRPGWTRLIDARSTSSATTRREATVYAPSWEQDDDNASGNSDGSWGSLKGAFDESALYAPTRPSSIDPNHARLAEKLSRDCVASLARLVAVFNPNGRVDVRDIASVEVLDVDDDHVDIEAVVCENDGCVTLAVPVKFPHPCQVGEAEHGVVGGQWDSCVQGNLDELDVEAEQVIRQLHWEEEHHEEVEAAKRELLTLQSSDTQDLHLPDWWVGGILSDECDSIRRILNADDMRADVVALATKSLSAHEYYDDWQVDQAAVAALCPAGMILRASAHQVELFGGGSGGDSQKNTLVVEIPVPFRERAASSDDLKASVMETVLAAADFVES